MGRRAAKYDARALERVEQMSDRELAALVGAASAEFPEFAEPEQIAVIVRKFARETLVHRRRNKAAQAFMEAIQRALAKKK